MHTTHRETIEEFKDQINISGVWNLDGNVKILDGVAPSVMSQLTSKAVAGREIWVEDELSKSVIEKLLEELDLDEHINIKIFGAATNALTIPTILKKTGQDISNNLYVLDGDILKTEDEREKIVNSILSGTEPETDAIKKEALKAVKQYKIKYAPAGTEKGIPEYNHKIMFESVDENINLKLFDLSKQIQGLDDWHQYYVKLSERSFISVENAQRRIINVIAEHSPDWNEYVSEIRDWILKAD